MWGRVLDIRVDMFWPVTKTETNLPRALLIRSLISVPAVYMYFIMRWRQAIQRVDRRRTHQRVFFPSCKRHRWKDRKWKHYICIQIRSVDGGGDSQGTDARSRLPWYIMRSNVVMISRLPGYPHVKVRTRTRRVSVCVLVYVDVGVSVGVCVRLCVSHKTETASSLARKGWWWGWPRR